MPVYRIIGFFTVIIIVFIVYCNPIVTIQQASALAPESQIISAKSGSRDLVDPDNKLIMSIGPDQDSVRIDFLYTGFDDNNHVIQLQCSWDGSSYARSNCASESPEAQRAFTGPDGVSRTYYVKTGTASREFPVGTNQFFGVRVVNDAGTVSSAKTLIFEVQKRAPSGPINPTWPSDEKVNIKVKFDSITVHDKHEGFAEGDGEYSLIAFVQGKPIDLTKATESGVCGGTSAPPYCGGLWDVANGQTIKFHSNAEVTLASTELFPLSIFTIGKEVDGCGRMSTDFYSEYQKNVFPGVFSNPKADWRQHIAVVQNGVAQFAECSFARDDNVLGNINEIYYPEKGDDLEGRHSFDSSTGDFTLRFTISVEPGPKQASQYIPVQ